ncbi:hypothetical protein FB451DRAFT_1412037 [Mycena latifolia]|nr:hypothetical protein FB451DRAFT_1412037 [Mycena latifolia]
MLKPKSSARYMPLPSAPEEGVRLLAACDDEPSSDEPLPAATRLAVLPARGGPALRAALSPRSPCAAMVLAALIRSSEDALERTWRDATLAETTLINPCTSPPEYHPDRLARALEVLGALGLTATDAHAPDVYRYACGTAPVVDVRPGAACACLPPGSPPRNPDTVGSSALP